MRVIILQSASLPQMVGDDPDHWRRISVTDVWATADEETRYSVERYSIRIDLSGADGGSDRTEKSLP